MGRGNTSLGLTLQARVFLPGAQPLPPAPVLPVDRPPDTTERSALDAALPRQPRHLAVAFSGDLAPGGWWGPARPSTWADAVAAIRYVASVLGVALAAEQDARLPWHPGRCARLVVGDVAVGHAGEIHPRVCRAWGVPARTSYAEVDVDAMVAAAPVLVHAPTFSTQPVAKEDVALVVPADVPAAAVERALRHGAGELLESVRLFDVYTGEQVPAGHKSLAFSLRLRAAERTLTEAEASAVRNAAVRAAAEATGARLRS